MIKAENLSYSFPHKELYNKISFTLEDDVHCAFIGTNGTGKSTLVNMILHPDKYLYDGKLIVDVPGRIGYVSQFYTVEEEKEITVFDYISEEFVRLQNKINQICEDMAVTDHLEELMEEYQLADNLSVFTVESGSLAADKTLAELDIHHRYGLTVLEETHKFFHGEKVAFGAIVQLVLENAPQEELERTIKYCQSVGLPTCFADLGVTEVTPEKVMKVAIGATAEGETIHNMPFPVTAEMVCGAIFAADKLGAHA